jgi:hypothetical protein
MLDRNDSFLESTCSAMFVYAIARGVNRGWLDEFAYGPIAQAGWNGLSTCITADGRTERACIGTNYANDFVYYYNRPYGDDIHAYGPMLLAGAEMIQLLTNERIRVFPPRGGGPAVYRDARDVPTGRGGGGAGRRGGGGGGGSSATTQPAPAESGAESGQSNRP